MAFEYPGFFPPDQDEGRNAHLNGCRNGARFPMYNSVAEVDDEGYARGCDRSALGTYYNTPHLRGK
jgi:hypothetical protein